MNTATVRDFDDNPVTVKVGDWVGFKSDYEQSGKIVEIKGGTYGTTLVLENENGFGGEYLRYATRTEESADRCWSD